MGFYIGFISVLYRLCMGLIQVSYGALYKGFIYRFPMGFPKGYTGSYKGFLYRGFIQALHRFCTGSWTAPPFLTGSR